MRNEFTELFGIIEQGLKNGRLTVAVDGGSASGKTTLAKLLKEKYDATVFHMDDFFLQPFQRTEERYREVGGNVDRERFLNEVLLPLSKDEKVIYRPFDCSKMALSDYTAVIPKKLVIIEGAYSMHPDLRKFYDYSVFLNIDEKLQRERILKRNTPALAERFFAEWIPMENRYFKEMQIKEICSIKFDITE